MTKQEKADSKSEYDNVAATIENRIAEQQQEQKAEFIPQTAADAMYLFLSDAERAPVEVDKDLKLSNFDQMERGLSLQFMKIIEDLNWIEREQARKLKEAKIRYGKDYEYINEDNNIMETVMEEVEAEMPSPEGYDDLGALRQIQDMSAVSKTKLGWFLRQMNTTISEQKNINEDKVENSPKWLDKFTRWKR